MMAMATTLKRTKSGPHHLDSQAFCIPTPRTPESSRLSPANPVLSDDSPEGGILVNKLRPLDSYKSEPDEQNDSSVFRKVKGVLNLRRGAGSPSSSTSQGQGSSSSSRTTERSPSKSRSRLSERPSSSEAPARTRGIEKIQSAPDYTYSRGRSQASTTDDHGSPQSAAKGQTRGRSEGQSAASAPHDLEETSIRRTSVPSSIAEDSDPNSSGFSDLRVTFAPLPDSNRQRSASFTVGTAARSGTISGQGPPKESSGLVMSSNDEKDLFRARDAVKFGKKLFFGIGRRQSIQEDSPVESLSRTASRNQDAHADMQREGSELAAAGLSQPHKHPDHPELQSEIADARPVPILMKPQDYSRPARSGTLQSLHKSQSSNAVASGSRDSASQPPKTTAGSTCGTGRPMRISNGMKQYLDEEGNVIKEEPIENLLTRRKSTGGMIGDPENKTSLEMERRGDLYGRNEGQQVTNVLDDDDSDEGDLADAAHSQDEQELWQLENDSPKGKAAMSPQALRNVRRYRAPPKSVDKILERERYNVWRRGGIPPSTDSKRLAGRLKYNQAASTTPGFTRDDWNDMSPEPSDSEEDSAIPTARKSGEILSTGHAETLDAKGEQRVGSSAQSESVRIAQSPTKAKMVHDDFDDDDLWPSSLHL